jgi:hypothetical protein
MKFMKKICFLMVVCLLLSKSIFSQSIDCNGYFAHKVGTKMEMTIYDKKEKPSSFLKYAVTKNTSIAGGTDISYSNEVFDKKNKSIAKTEYSIKCQGGQFITELRNFISQSSPTSPDMEVSITGDKVLYPHKLVAGQVLPDAKVEVKTGMKGGMTLMTINTSITNRKVEGFETIETPAGKFECVKISYNFESKMTLGKLKGSCTEYLAKGVGVVKSENFDKNGKKTDSNVLTKLEK